MPWRGREGPHSRKTFVKGGFNSGDGRRAAMGAPYVTRACMGPIGVLANHPGRSATLSRRPVPPTRFHHPRYLKGPGVVAPKPSGVWGHSRGFGGTGKRVPGCRKSTANAEKKGASEGRGTGAPVGRFASFFRRDRGAASLAVSLPEHVRPNPSRSSATPMRSSTLPPCRIVTEPCDIDGRIAPPIASLWYRDVRCAARRRHPEPFAVGCAPRKGAF